MGNTVLYFVTRPEIKSSLPVLDGVTVQGEYSRVGETRSSTGIVFWSRLLLNNNFCHTKMSQ